MKIVGLMPVKNEEWILDLTLPRLKLFTDEILALYTPSTDNTLNLLKKHRVKVKEQPYYPVNYSLWRQRLLEWGREIGGTHFVWLDVDEAFTSNLLSEFRNFVKTLKPGQKMTLCLLCLWKDARKYRDDNSIWSNSYKDVIFCDDGKSGFFSSINLHEGRTPGRNTNNNLVRLPLEKGAVLHFQFVPAERFQMKQAFQRCRELVLGKDEPLFINSKYSITLDDNTALCKDVPASWLEGIEGLDALKDTGVGWYYVSIKDFFAQKGIEFFEPLQIWHIPQLRNEFINKIGREPQPVIKCSIFRKAKRKIRAAKNILKERFLAYKI